MDLTRCPVFSQKSYLLDLLPSPMAGLPPSARYFKAGRLADDFDGDGIVENGYMTTGGSGGRQFDSGYVEAVGYDPKTGLLKYGYSMLVRESQNPYTTFILEAFAFYRVR
ncbi:hypothetical protein [Thermus tenuipuniceus]|uniref:hypothetical protein n=1 Tax=Thermus tenuipuniceus TaxID=2078690 RepID=UPI001FC909AD|nr:hypothetical protein [Thermus tenuipuniceus]